MDRSAYKGFSNYKALIPLYGDAGVEPQPKYHAVIENLVESVDEILSYIFSYDEKTNSPNGDLGQFLNDNVDPGLREYVKNQLLIDTSPARVSPAPSELSDMEVFEFARQDGESRDNYANRLRAKFEQARDYIINHRSKTAENPSNVQK